MSGVATLPGYGPIYMPPGTRLLSEAEAAEVERELEEAADPEYWWVPTARRWQRIAETTVLSPRVGADDGLLTSVVAVAGPSDKRLLPKGGR